MSAVDITFYINAAIAIYAGWRVFVTDSMVRASFFLLISFLAVGVIMLLLGDSMLVFESAGVTLLATMIAVVMLTSHRGRYGDANHGSRPPGLEPGGDPADMPAEAKEEGHQHHH